MSIPLAIVGYGKMGRMVEQFAPEYGFQVAAKLDITEMAKFRQNCCAVQPRRLSSAIPRLRRTIYGSLAGLG